MKTQIERKLRRKTDVNLIETIIKSKKNPNWIKTSNIISGSTKKQVSINLDEIDKKAKDNETIVIHGKVLGVGEVNKKIKIVALDFSSSAKEKLKKAGIEMREIKDEIKENPDAKNIHILN